MATVGQGLQVKTRTVQAASEQKNMTLKGILSQDNVKARFNELLGKKAPGFLSSLLAVVNDNDLLKKAKPESILAAAATAAALDLPINKNFGFAYIIPYGREAQFQMGYKGYLQLALRSAQYKTITSNVVREGEIKNFNRFTDQYEKGEATSNKVIGYLAYFKLLNGFEKSLYMSVDEMVAHAKAYSKMYRSGTEKWGQIPFDKMATKTVLKQLLSHYGILSVEMQMALQFDGGILSQDSDGNISSNFEGKDYNPELDEDGPEGAIDTEGKVVEPPNNIDYSTGEILDAEPSEPIAAAPSEGGQETLL